MLPGRANVVLFGTGTDNENSCTYCLYKYCLLYSGEDILLVEGSYVTEICSLYSGKQEGRTIDLFGPLSFEIETYYVSCSSGSRYLTMPLKAAAMISCQLSRMSSFSSLC